MKSSSRVVVKDHGFDALMRRAREIAAIGGGVVKVGVLADDKRGGLHEVGPDGESSRLTIAEIFAVLNFGTRDGRIPPRPVLQATFDAKRAELKELGSRLIGDVVFGHLTLEHALGIMGSQLAADVKAAIVAGFPPPNAPSTARAKAMKGRGVAASRSKLRTASARAQDDLDVRARGHLGPERKGAGKRLANLAAATQKARVVLAGSYAGVKALIDTGRVLGAVTWLVVTGRQDNNKR